MIKLAPTQPHLAFDLSQITPFILTYNEEPNIARCLAQLSWASRIVVVDSGSTDRTLELVARYPQAGVIQRPFDSHSRQSNFALSLIETQWVLSLDADYLLTPGFQRMLREGEWRPECAYFAPFRVCVCGRPLRTSLYPPRAVLFSRANAIYQQDGHTQRLDVSSRTAVLLPEPLLHDDRKSRHRWRENQRRYAELEAGKLAAASPTDLNFPDRIRHTGWLAPLIILPYLIFVRGLFLNGRIGLQYALERTAVEVLLCCALFKRRLGPRSSERLIDSSRVS